MTIGTYDIVVVGAGPAGASAAARAAQLGRQVVMVDRATFPRRVPCMGWLNHAAAGVLETLGASASLLGGRRFTRVLLFNADFSKQAIPSLPDGPGYLINRNELDGALVDLAKSHNAQVILGREVSKVELLDKRVRLELAGGDVVEAGVLLLATGRGSDLPNRVGLMRERIQRPMWTAYVEAAGAHDGAEPMLAVVLGLDRKGGTGVCRVSSDCVALSVSVAGGRAEAVAALRDMSARAAAAGVVRVDLAEKVSNSAECTAVGAALDSETHVGKHTLLIGEAGGFIAATSHEGLYPGMWSGVIAAEIAHEAVEAGRRNQPTQDVLMRFDSEWRMRMADYLRSPHTELQFLLPLIFSSQPMADRMGAAWFYGQNG